jgi:hypothetical protein
VRKAQREIRKWWSQSSCFSTIVPNPQTTENTGPLQNIHLKLVFLGKKEKDKKPQADINELRIAHIHNPCKILLLNIYKLIF